MDSGSPYCGPVKDLIDPYRDAKPSFNQESEDYNELGRTKAWLAAHPGRWAAIRQGAVSGGKYPGLETRQRTLDGKSYVFARVWHPEGESLDDALARTKPMAYGRFPSDLPVLTKDRFGWTPEELEEACRAARMNLFPVEEVSDASEHDRGRVVAVG